jgi:lysophospholipase L1-like esterase
VLVLLLLACTETKALDSGGESTAAVDSTPTESVADSEPTADSVDSVPTDSVDSAPPSMETGDSAAPEPLSCLEQLAAKQPLAPDYAQFSPVLNSACLGTNHQDIAGVQHVVFVGDSVTVGTPPNTVETFYRNVMAEDLSARFGIEAPAYEWYWYDLFTGNAYMQDSGAFSVCAKYGARTDDLVQDHDQIIECIPESRAGETTLIVMTVGGNDLFSLVEDYHEGIPVEELWTTVEGEVQLLREALSWVKTDKDRFPGEMYVIFANLFEFTDGEGNVDACPGAASLGYTYDLSAPDLQAMIQYYQEQYMSIAVETQSDMVFMGEGFCGHGYNSTDTAGPCYRPDNQDVWFDLTCFHPNDDGHVATAEMMLSVVDE